jgi:hypothetical protein
VGQPQVSAREFLDAARTLVADEKGLLAMDGRKSLSRGDLLPPYAL